MLEKSPRARLWDTIYRTSLLQTIKVNLYFWAFSLRTIKIHLV